MESMLFLLIISAMVTEIYGFSPYNVKRHKRFDSDSGDHRVASLSSSPDSGDHKAASLSTSPDSGDHRVASLSSSPDSGDHRVVSLSSSPDSGDHRVASLSSSPDSGDHRVASLSSSPDSVTETRASCNIRSGTREVCKDSDHRCENLPVIPNGKLNTKKKYLWVNEVASIKCDRNYCLSQYNYSLIRGDSIFRCNEKMAKEDRYHNMPTCIQDMIRKRPIPQYAYVHPGYDT